MVVQSPVTLDKFEEFINLPENRDRLFELIDGEIIEKVPTEEHGIMALDIGTEFNLYLRQNKIGRAGVEIRHQMPGDKKNSYLPDVMVRLDVDTPIVKQGVVPRMPDLAVEIQSPDDSIKKLREKARYYLANGTRILWLVLTTKRIVEVYTPDDEYVLTEGDTLDGGDVLPGFKLAVKAIFKD